MLTKEKQGEIFYRNSFLKSWREIFEELTPTQRNQTSHLLHAYEKTYPDKDTQEFEHLKQFILNFDSYSEQLTLYEQKTQKYDMSQIWKKAMAQKSKKPSNRIKEPEKNMRGQYRSRSSSRSLSYSRQPKLFQCIFKICPRFAKSRGSNRRYNPKKPSKQKTSKKKPENTNKTRSGSRKNSRNITRLQIVPLQRQKQGSDQNFE